MKRDEILEEVWRNRDEFAKQYDYDLDRIVDVLQKLEKHPLSRVVDRRRKKPGKAPKNPKQ